LINDGTPYEFESLMYGAGRGKIWRLYQMITYRHLVE